MKKMLTIKIGNGFIFLKYVPKMARIKKFHFHKTTLKNKTKIILFRVFGFRFVVRRNPELVK